MAAIAISLCHESSFMNSRVAGAFVRSKSNPRRSSCQRGSPRLQRFGANVRAARLARGWTQEDLAHKTGLASVQVSRIERGKREVRLSTLVRLVRALDISPAELLSGLL